MFPAPFLFSPMPMMGPGADPETVARLAASATGAVGQQQMANTAAQSPYPFLNAAAFMPFPVGNPWSLWQSLYAVSAVPPIAPVLENPNDQTSVTALSQDLAPEESLDDNVNGGEESPPSSRSCSSDHAETHIEDAAASSSSRLNATTNRKPRKSETVSKRSSDSVKNRRKRTAFTSKQLTSLEREFVEKRYLSLHERGELAKQLGLSELQVKIWVSGFRLL